MIGPHTVVPGARRRMDSLGINQLKDKKGRPLWDMPEPIGYLETVDTRWVRGKPFKTKLKFPIYRGATAEDFRRARGQWKRMKRKQAEKSLMDKIKDMVRT